MLFTYSFDLLPNSYTSWSVIWFTENPVNLANASLCKSNLGDLGWLGWNTSHVSTPPSNRNLVPLANLNVSASLWLREDIESKLVFLIAEVLANSFSLFDG